MNPTQYHRRSTDWLLKSQLSPFINAYKQRLIEGCYSTHTINTYLACIAHFAQWLTKYQFDIKQIDETTTHEFLDVHLPSCDCAWPVNHIRHDLRAALSHLLVVLRISNVIVERQSGTTSVDLELQRFDEYIDHVSGLAARTRSQYLHIIHRLLIQKFTNRDVDMQSLVPDDLRQFIAYLSKFYTTSASLEVPISALRSYLRFRTTCGEQVHHLIGVVIYPANWQLAVLPKALSNDEVARLHGVLDDSSLSSRRDNAIVRCVLDLGLRVGEVAKLNLDDINWQAGTVTLRKTKSRREDVLPLQEVTGCAIADYLKFERPQTNNRGVYSSDCASR